MAEVDLWETRNKAIDFIAGPLAGVDSLIRAEFALLDLVITEFSRLSGSDVFPRVCGLTTAKGRALLQATYSLILDGLAQEAGALLRPSLEAYELLVYFALDRARAEEAVAGTLPSAGIIAKRIGGSFMGLREHFNTNASHIAFTPYSMRHLIDYRAAALRTSQPFLPGLLRVNMEALFAILALFTAQCVPALETAGSVQSAMLADEGDRLWSEGRALMAPGPTSPHSPSQ
jgi:hypothetical protein